MSRTRVLVIDDHERVRTALLSRLGRDRDLQVATTAASTDTELEETLEFEPDVVLLDVKRSDGSGIEICRKLVRERPSIRILILTSFPDQRERREVEALGVSGYLLKDLDLQELVRQIKGPQASGVHESTWGGVR